MGDNYLFTTTHSKGGLLDKIYQKHITCILKTLDENIETRWEVYNLIICHLHKNTGKDYLSEVKYRLTDGENPNDIIMSIIERENDGVDNLIWSLKKRVEGFIDEDFFKRFLP